MAGCGGKGSSAHRWVAAVWTGATTLARRPRDPAWIRLGLPASALPRRSRDAAHAATVAGLRWDGLPSTSDAVPTWHAWTSVAAAGDSPGHARAAVRCGARNGVSFSTAWRCGGRSWGTQPAGQCGAACGGWAACVVAPLGCRAGCADSQGAAAHPLAHAAGDKGDGGCGLVRQLRQRAVVRSCSLVGERQEC